MVLDLQVQATLAFVALLLWLFVLTQIVCFPNTAAFRRDCAGSR